MKRLPLLGVALFALGVVALPGPATAGTTAEATRTLRFTGELGPNWSATGAGGATNWTLTDGSYAFPADGDRLVLPDGIAQTAPVDDLQGLRVDGLIVEGDYSELSGVPLRIGKTGLIVNGGGPVAIMNDLILASNSTIAAPGANLSLGKIDLHDHLLTFGSSADTTGYLEVGAPIAGAGAIRKIGASTVLLEGDSDYHGPTTVAAGVISISTSDAFGTDDTNVVTVQPGATVGITGNPSLPVEFVLAGGELDGIAHFGDVEVTAASRMSMVSWSGFALPQIYQVGGDGDLEIDGKNVNLTIASLQHHTGRLTLVGPSHDTAANFQADLAGSGGAVNLQGWVGVSAQGLIAGQLRQFGASYFEPFEVVTVLDYRLGKQATLVVSPGPYVPTVRALRHVSLAGHLQLFGFQPPPPGQSVPLIDNAGARPVDGTFVGLPEGSVVDGTVLSYVGGDGNDVTLTTPS